MPSNNTEIAVYVLLLLCIVAPFAFFWGAWKLIYSAGRAKKTDAPSPLVSRGVEAAPSGLMRKICAIALGGVLTLMLWGVTYVVILVYVVLKAPVPIH